MCVIDCGEQHCPYAREFAGPMQPVPQFAAIVREMINLGRKEKPVPSQPSIPTRDAAAAVKRVLDLHSRCTCNACAGLDTMKACRGCNEHWPCPTVNAVRGIVRLVE